MKAVLPFGAVLGVALILGVPPAARNDKVSPPACAAGAIAGPAQPGEEQPESSNAVRAPHPLAEADCGGQGWRAFTAPGFQNRKACQDWVREKLGPGETREFLFPEPRANGGANLRKALPFLI